jgi:hypothetical protein
MRTVRLRAAQEIERGDWCLGSVAHDWGKNCHGRFAGLGQAPVGRGECGRPFDRPQNQQAEVR